MALVYFIILVCDKWWYDDDNFVSIPFERTADNRVSTFVTTAVFYAIFIIASIFVLGMTSIGKQYSSMMGIQNLLATSVPILQGNKIFTLLSWGIVIPIIETRVFFGRIYEGLAAHAKDYLGKEIPVDRITPATIGLMIFVSALFTLFHISSKGMETPALMVTFIFAMLSLIFVTVSHELKGPSLLHIITNSISVIKSVGWF